MTYYYSFIIGFIITIFIFWLNSMLNEAQLYHHNNRISSYLSDINIEIINVTNNNLTYDARKRYASNIIPNVIGHQVKQIEYPNDVKHIFSDLSDIVYVNINKPLKNRDNNTYTFLYLTGHLRSFMHTAVALKKFIELSSFGERYYICLWTYAEIDAPSVAWWKKEPKKKLIQVLQKINFDFYSVIKYAEEMFANHIGIVVAKPRNCNGPVCLFQHNQYIGAHRISRYVSERFLNGPNQYDIVYKLRPDVLISHGVDSSQFLKFIQLDKYVIFALSHKAKFGEKHDPNEIFFATSWIGYQTMVETMLIEREHLGLPLSRSLRIDASSDFCRAGNIWQRLLFCSAHLSLLIVRYEFGIKVVRIHNPKYGPHIPKDSIIPEFSGPTVRLDITINMKCTKPLQNATFLKDKKINLCPNTQSNKDPIYALSKSSQVWSDNEFWKNLINKPI